MEYSDAGSLRDAMGRAFFRENPLLIQSIFRDVITGLAYLHAESIIHRDIKPVRGEGMRIVVRQIFYSHPI